MVSTTYNRTLRYIDFIGPKVTVKTVSLCFGVTFTESGSNSGVKTLRFAFPLPFLLFFHPPSIIDFDPTTIV